MIYILFIAIAIISYVVQNSLKSKFKRYSQINVDGNYTGKEIAERMLHDNNIYDVKVISTSGMLTDHYNPANKTVNLSDTVYSNNSISAAAVAAHECGHAIQHAYGYSPLSMRSALVPIVSFASNIMIWIILAGIILIQSMPQILLIGIILFATTTLFSFITLPVEIDASRRAITWLQSSNIAVGEKNEFAKDALKSAAYTYVVAALGSLATLIYYIFIFTTRSRD